jgi:hypothetical protein
MRNSREPILSKRPSRIGSQEKKAPSRGWCLYTRSRIFLRTSVPLLAVGMPCTSLVPRSSSLRRCLLNTTSETGVPNAASAKPHASELPRGRLPNRERAMSLGTFTLLVNTSLGICHMAAEAACTNRDLEAIFCAVLKEPNTDPPRTDGEMLLKEAVRSSHESNYSTDHRTGPVGASGFEPPTS